MPLSHSAPRQLARCTNIAWFHIPWGNVNHDADLSIKVDQRIRNAWCSFRKYTLGLDDRPSAPLELKIRMLKAEVLQTMLFGCVTWSPRLCHLDALRRVHHNILTRYIGWWKHNRADHLISYLDTLVKTGSKSIEATLCKRQILSEEFVAHMEGTRLLKCVMFGDSWGTRFPRGDKKRSGWGVFWTTSELLVSRPTSGWSQLKMRMKCTKQWNNVRNSLWQNGSRQSEPGLDYDTQQYVRTWQAGPKRGWSKASVLVLVCSPLLISLSDVAAVILHISDAAFFYSFFSLNQARLFVHVCSSVGIRSVSRTKLLSNCVPLLCFLFCFFVFFSKYISYTIHTGFLFFRTSWISEIGLC